MLDQGCRAGWPLVNGIHAEDLLAQARRGTPQVVIGKDLGIRGNQRSALLDELCDLANNLRAREFHFRQVQDLVL